MAEEISNKTLAVIVVAAIVVTLGSTALILRMGAPVITGMAITQAGTASFNITSVTSIAIPDALIDFGQGAVTAGEASATIDTDGTNTSWEGTVPNDMFVIENDGNIDIDINVNATVDADGFIGGTADINSFKWKVDKTEAGEASACQTSGMDAYEEVTTTTNTLFCGNLSSIDAADLVAMDLQLVIPSDAVPGSKSASINFIASATS